ncbi:2-dehydro-3-deoxy-6-phosphogalactonate aldolase [Raoultella ornithinolytica]|nr:2-dehydro-3-deoxy-6-phosphogalactonate aldolase [Raoultella ornithinolytica]
MQWQTKIPLIAILRGVTPEEALAHVGAVINAGFDARRNPAELSPLAAEHSGDC